MRIIHGIKSLGHPISRSVVTIGNFDGVHLGHRELLARVISESQRFAAEAVVMTFSPHPRQILFPDQKFFRLFPFEDQVRELKSLGVGTLIVEPFSRELSEIRPESFLEDWILKPLSPLKLVVGYDFTFGANRSGTLPLLERFAKSHELRLEIVPPFEVGGQTVSSTLIRKALAEGRVDQAWEWLGRPFYLSGVVVKGDQRGRQLGFPTANLAFDGDALPLTGVYAGWTLWKSKRYRSVANIGKNPTFLDEAGKPLRVEIYIMDFHQDIYGETLQFEFEKFLRPEQRFASLKELAAQIARDVEAARKMS